jgi:hypothetical protein
MKQPRATQIRRVILGRISVTTRGNYGRCIEAVGFWWCDSQLS